jgi:hypothetical protein
MLAVSQTLTSLRPEEEKQTWSHHVMSFCSIGTDINPIILLPCINQNHISLGTKIYNNRYQEEDVVSRDVLWSQSTAITFFTCDLLHYYARHSL